MNDAAERVTAVEAGRALLRDLNIGDGLSRNAIPVDPAAERVVQRNSVLENQGAAGAVRTQAAQRNSLGRGICRTAAGAPEEAESGNLAKVIIQSERGSMLQVFARELHIADWNIRQSASSHGSR